MSEKARLTHFGRYLPTGVSTNSDIVKDMRVDINEDVLFRSVGSKEKCVADSAEMGSDMMASVGAKILDKAGLSGKEIDMLICSCDPVDQAAPDTAVITQHKLGLACPAFGISMSCVGWICGTSVASAILSADHRKILVLSSSTVGSKFRFNSPMHRAIFGDGAGGVLIEAGVQHGAEILAVELLTLGEHFTEIYAPMTWSNVPASIPEQYKNSFFMNNDNKVFFDALDKQVKPFFFNALKKANIKISDIDRFIVHQASMPIFLHTIKSFGIPSEKVANYYHKYGNTISAELPIYVDLEIQSKKITPGDLVLLFTYGAGFTAGLMVLKFR